MHYIYYIFNSINNKIYIGQTNDSDKRWIQHQYLARKKPVQYIHRAMIKHGIDHFSYEVITSCLTQHEANNIEERLIVLFQSNVQGIGYNLKRGGHCSPHAESTKQKISEANKGQIPWILGKKMPPEFGEAVSKAKKGIITTPQNLFKPGHQLSEKDRLAVSLRMTGATPWNKGLEGAKQPRFGHKNTDAHNQILIESNKKKRKLTMDDAIEIRALSLTGLSSMKISKRFEISDSSVRDIIKFRTYKN